MRENLEHRPENIRSQLCGNTIKDIDTLITNLEKNGFDDHFAGYDLFSFAKNIDSAYENLEPDEQKIITDKLNELTDSGLQEKIIDTMVAFAKKEMVYVEMVENNEKEKILKIIRRLVPIENLSNINGISEATKEWLEKTNDPKKQVWPEEMEPK